MQTPPLEDDLLPDLPGVPTSKDKLFGSQEDWWNNACLNWSSGSWTLYSSGYKSAADLLVEKVEETSSRQDSLVYPILFLYRQYLELEIKDTLSSARKLLDIDKAFPAHHRISDLWVELNRLLAEIFPGDSTAELKQIGRLINEFSKVDPLSMAFRYPTDKDGNPSLPGLTHINLRNVRDVIAKISITLSGANSQVYEYLQFKLDREREFGGEW